MFRKIILTCVLLFSSILFAEVIEDHLAYFLGEPVMTVKYDTNDKGKYYTKAEIDDIAKDSFLMVPFSLEDVEFEDADPATKEKLKDLIRKYGKVEVRAFLVNTVYYTCKEGSVIKYFAIANF